MTGGGDRTAQRTHDTDQLIFPLVAKPSPRPAWVGKTLAGGLIVVALAVAVTVAFHQARTSAGGGKWAGVTAGADEPPAQVDPDGATQASVFELQPGTCLRDADVPAVQDVFVVPCETEHRAEVIATAQMPDGQWPGRAAVDDFAVQECVPAIFEVGMGSRRDLKWSYFGPTERSWTIRDDRRVSCMIVSDGSPLEGSIVSDPAASSGLADSLLTVERERR